MAYIGNAAVIIDPFWNTKNAVIKTRRFDIGALEITVFDHITDNSATKWKIIGKGKVDILARWGSKDPA